VACLDDVSSFFIFLTTCYLPAYIYTLLSFFSLHRQQLYCACMHVWSLLTFLSLSIYSDNTYIYIFMLCFIHLCMFKVFLLYIYWSPSYTVRKWLIRLQPSVPIMLWSGHFSIEFKFENPQNHLSTEPSHQPVLKWCGQVSAPPRRASAQPPVGQASQRWAHAGADRMSVAAEWGRDGKD